MPRRSLTELLDSYYTRFANDVAVVQPRGYRRESWSYAQVRALACRFAQELDRLDIRKGHRIVVWGDNRAEWVAVFFGAMMRGVVVVPMDRIGAPDFVERVYRQVEARLLVGSKESISQLPGLNRVSFEELPERLREHSATTKLGEVERSDTLQIVFTSGTTAEPRGVVTTHGNVLANLEPFEGEIDKYRRYERFFHPIRFLEMVPLSHVFGQFMGVFIPPLLGGTVVFEPALNPAEIQKTIREERVSVLVAVPRIVEALKNQIERKYESEGRLDELRRKMDSSAKDHFGKRWWRFRRVHAIFGWKFWAIVCGGATLDSATEEFWRRLSFVVLQGYGLTETTSLVSVNHPFKRGAGSIGKVLPGREMKLSESGEILVRGENIAGNYFQKGQMQPVLGQDGWFHTGDLGELDPQGFLHFKGRAKNVIVTPEGMKVYPEDLERALRQDPNVKDCVVVPIRRGGNAEACAVLLLHRPEHGAEAALKAANAALASYQQMRHSVIWPEADFPRTATQKPKTNLIVEAAERMLGGAKETVSAGGVGELLAKVKGASGLPLSAGSELDRDLHLTSIERVELMCAIEDRYQLSLNETSFAEIKTVGELNRLLAEPPSEQKRTDYHYPRWARRWPLPWLRTLIYYFTSWPATYLLAWPKIVGAEKLRAVRGPVVIVCNHVTYVDAGFVLAALPARLRHRLAIAMEGERVEAMRRPPASLNWLARGIERISWALMTALFHVFPLPKLSGFRESFAFAGELADAGHSILVFPEGLRTRDGHMNPFMRGTGLLVERLGLPVIPIRIDGLWEAAQRRQTWVRSGSITVRVGDPVKFRSGENADSVVKALEERMKGL